jgi:signal transduction histidine kinase
LPEISRGAVPAAVLIGGLVLTMLVAAFAQRVGRTQEALAFANVANTVQHQVASRLEAYTAMLRSGAGLFAASEEVSLAEFRAFVSRLELETRYPGIQGIGFSKLVRPESRERIQTGIRQAAAPEFRFWPGEDPSVPVHAIIYLEPLDARNRLALGFDMSSEPVRQAAMERARDTSLPAATGRVTLVQEGAEAGQEQFGFLIYMPVYRAGALPQTVEERRARLFGFVYSPFRVDDLLRGIVGDSLGGAVYLEVYDGPLAQGRIMHRSAADAAPPSRLAVRRTLDVAGREWTLVIRPSTPPFISLIDLFVVMFVAGGAVLSALLFRITRDEMRGREAAEQTARELRASEEALRAANRAKDDFLAVVSHELRTPLNAILGWSQMLRRGEVPPERVGSALDTIHRNAGVQVKLVGDLLDMSQAISGHLRLDPQPIDPGAVISAIVESLRPMAAEAGVQLEWDPPPASAIHADPSRLEQIVRNLLSNAIKFTPGGGSVRVAVERSGADFLVHVRDTGIGIPPHLLDAVFEPFRQGDTSTTRAHGGVGLGLSIARHLVELHGGSITAASDGPGKGSVFTVRLPVQPSATRPPSGPLAGVAQTAT